MLENHKSLLLSNLADLGPECLSLFSVRTYSFPPWVFRHTPRSVSENLCSKIISPCC